MLARYYAKAETMADFVARAEANADLWKAFYARPLPADLVEEARSLESPLRLLVLLEDWCGDAVNTVPVLARLAEEAPDVELRVLERDRNPELMDAYLSNGSRSIPVVIVMDGDGRELGWWGPRPRELQAWFLAHGRALPPEERYREIRRWYARDHGRSAVREVLEIARRAEAAPALPGHD